MHSARIIASSIAWQAPWPKFGVSAWAASPMNTMRLSKTVSLGDVYNITMNHINVRCVL